MLSIEPKYAESVRDMFHEWHVGSPFPSIITHRVASVQADEDELTHIIALFTRGGVCTLPVANVRVMVWYGDTAKMIVEALRKGKQ